MIISKRLIFSLGVLLTAAGLAASADAAAPRVSQDFFKSSTHNGSLHRGASIPAATVGFYAFHATTCAVYNPTSSGGQTYLFIYPQEGGYLFTDSPYDQIVIAPECAANNVMGVDVINTNGDWNNIYAFSHQ